MTRGGYVLSEELEEGKTREDDGGVEVVARKNVDDEGQYGGNDRDGERNCLAVCSMRSSENVSGTENCTEVDLRCSLH